MNYDTAQQQRVAQVRELLAEDRLREALNLLLLTSDAPALPRNELRLLQSQLADQERDARQGTETAESLDIRRNQIRKSLLHCADLLEQPAPEVLPGGSAENPDARLQKHAFRLLLTGKIALLLFIAFHFHIHAYSQGETLTLLGLLSPVLVGYLLTAVQGREAGASGNVSAANRSFLRGLVYFGLPLYFFIIFWILRKVPLDEWTFDTARNWIIGIEVAFGGLVAYIVKTLFSKT